MKHFMIKYDFKQGDQASWHQEIDRFIAAITDDPELKGRIGYRCMKNLGDNGYVHLASVADDATQKALQSRDFFKRYSETLRKVAGGEVTVTPVDMIGGT